MIKHLDYTFRGNREETILSSPTSGNKKQITSGTRMGSGNKNGDTSQKVKNKTKNSGEGKGSRKVNKVTTKKVHNKHTTTSKRKDSGQPICGTNKLKMKRKRVNLYKKVVKRSKTSNRK